MAKLFAPLSLAEGLGLLVGLVVASPAGAQEAFVRNTVVEEYTGTWCENCPRGIVGLQRLGEDFGDRVICIAVHVGTGEPMLIPTYYDVQEMLLPGSGVPVCTIDRATVQFDPYSGSRQRGRYHYGIDLDVAAFLEQPTEAKVELVAEWDDAQQWDVRFTATTTFNIDSEEAPYRLVFVLLADGLSGTDSSWWQANNVSLSYQATAGYDYADDDMQFWRDAPYNVEGLEYNHVPVNTLGVKNGIAGSISAPITAWQPQTYVGQVTTLATHAKKLIQDKSRLSAVAMLINTGTGRVVNAVKAPIQPYGYSGIVAPAAATHETAGQIFDLQGRRLAAPPTRGAYISNHRIHIINK